MSMETNTARQHLALAGRERDWSTRLASGLTVGAMTLLLVGLVALVDYWLMLPVSARWSALAVTLVLLAAGAGRLRVFWRRPTSLKQAALDFENRQPAAGCEVSTAAEYLAGERTAGTGYEADLVAALEQKVAGTLQRQAVSYRGRLVKPAMAAGFGVFGLLVFTATFPAAGTAMKRTLMPWSRAAFTQLEVHPGSIEFPVGKDLEFTNVFTGRLPQTAELQVRGKGQTEWVTHRLASRSNGVFRHTLRGVKESFAYRVAGGDAHSPEFTGTAYVPPAVKEFHVALEFPAYTELRTARVASADFTAVRGTTARVQLVPTTALSQARLRFPDGTGMELKADDSGMWSGAIPLAKDLEYSVELTDAKGRKGAEDVRHHVTVLPDAAPKVDFAQPGQDLRSAATNSHPLEVTAVDDFGVTEVKIVYHRLGDSERELILKRPAAAEASVTVAALLDLTPLKLAPYDVVAYHAVARDNNTLDGPGEGRSPVYFIEITEETGIASKSKPKPGQKLNLLIVQKQIIADTTALGDAAPAASFLELAVRQREALAFAQKYEGALAQTGAPVAAQAMMHAAVTSMQQAAVALARQARAGALPPEDAALAALYQTLKILPALQDLPTVPPIATDDPPKEEPSPAVRVVLEAIKQLKKAPAPEGQQELAKLLDQIQKLSRQQSGLTTACQNPGDGSSPNADANSNPLSRPAKAAEADSSPQSDQAEANAKANAKAEAKAKEMAKAKGKGKGKAKGQGKGQGQGEGQGQGQGQGQAGEPKEESLAKLAPQEEQLSRDAQKLAEKLNRLLGQGARSGQGAGKRLTEAAGKMKEAAQAMRQGNRPAAGSASAQGSEALGSAAAQLEQLLQDRPELLDVSAEEAPRQFEGPIADYFKRLSRAE